MRKTRISGVLLGLFLPWLAGCGEEVTPPLGPESDMAMALFTLQTEEGDFVLTCHNQTEGSIFDWYGTMLIKTDVNGVIQWNRTFSGVLSSPFLFLFVHNPPLIQTIDGGFALAGVVFSEHLSTVLVETDNDGKILWEKTYKEEEMDVCFVSSLLQTLEGDFILAGSVLFAAESGFDLFDSDLWLGLFIPNVEYLSGLELLPFLIAIYVITKYEKKI